jgi:hypothetical protein
MRREGMLRRDLRVAVALAHDPADLPEPNLLGLEKASRGAIG